MLKIRLQRVGRKHEPTFRLVLTDSKNSTKSGKLLEILGNYDSRHREDSVFKLERVAYWISKGAQVSDTIHNLLIDKKIISGKKKNVLLLKKAIIKEVKSVKEEILTEIVSEEPIVVETTEEVKPKVSTTEALAEEVA